MPTILIADDEAPVRELLRRVLSKAGYQVLTAGDGMDAIKIAREQTGKIDLVVSDMVMPGIDGAELYRRMKGEWPQMNFLFISGYAGRTLPDAPFLSKPFAPGLLSEKVRQVLDVRSA